MSRPTFYGKNSEGKLLFQIPLDQVQAVFDNEYLNSKEGTTVIIAGQSFSFDDSLGIKNLISDYWSNEYSDENEILKSKISSLEEELNSLKKSTEYKSLQKNLSKIDDLLAENDMLKRHMNELQSCQNCDNDNCPIDKDTGYNGACWKHNFKET